MSICCNVRLRGYYSRLHGHRQVFWSFLFPELGKRAAFIEDFKVIPNLGGIYVDGPLKNKLFCRDKVK